MDRTILAGAFTAFVITALLAPLIIPLLRRLKFGQNIRQEGPRWHSGKTGTPTMGGLIFIIGITAAVVLFFRGEFKVAMLLYLAMSFGAVGFFDDYIKVAKKRNLGLTELQKLLLQLVASVIFVAVLYCNGNLGTKLIIPFTDLCPDLGWLYLPFAVLVIIATVNAVNLTDGVDGLASSVTVIVCTFFAAAAYLLEQSGTAAFSACLAGGTLGFLLFNKYPAKVFMGDTGALFLGGGIAGIAIVAGLPLVLVIAGGVYLLETLSVILQVIAFKTTGKRLFKMSPIHHHFEMSGWSENKIVTVFSIISLLLCAVSYVGIRSFLGLMQ